MEELAYINVQCTSNTGEVGTFLTRLEGKGDRNPISPVFKDLSELLMWMKERGWLLTGNVWQVKKYKEG